MSLRSLRSFAAFIFGCDISRAKFEVVSQSVVSKRQGFLTEADYDRWYAAAEKQSRMLSGLRKSLLENRN